MLSVDLSIEKALNSFVHLTDVCDAQDEADLQA